MLIRLAQAADIDDILRLGTTMHGESRFARYPLDVDKTREAIAALLATPASGCVLLAVHSLHGAVGLLAGHLADYFFADVRIAQDKAFYVLPAHRGSAAALKLLIAFRRWAELRQARELCINSGVDIEPQRFDRFMRHLRFRTTGSNHVLHL